MNKKISCGGDLRTFFLECSAINSMYGNGSLAECETWNQQQVKQAQQSDTPLSCLPLCATQCCLAATRMACDCDSWLNIIELMAARLTRMTSGSTTVVPTVGHDAQSHQSCLDGHYL
jgi:hypothetical protein